MTLSRRGFLGVAGLSVLGVASVGSLVLPGAAGQTAELMRSRARLPEPFSVPLPIPPLARRVRTDAPEDRYTITQREASVEILPGLRTRILGYDGIFPGPTVVSRSGRRTVVTHRNELAVPTVVHLHGGHTPAESDGYPTDLVAAAGLAPRTRDGRRDRRWGSATTSIRASSGRPRSGTTTTGWTSPVRRSTAGSPAST